MAIMSAAPITRSNPPQTLSGIETDPEAEAALHAEMLQPTPNPLRD